MNWRRITQDELEVFLRKHKLWLADEPGGERADLSGADLSGADLSGADLSGADLYGADLSRANLSGADLYGADLSRADLSRANLSGAYLSGAYLSGAYLSGADLSGADLSGADLSGADLYGADLSRANLSGADLYGADLSRADLYGADLSRADLYGADLSRAKNVNYPIACPEKGSFTAFKKARGNYIVKLEVPADALRSSASSRKCRCSKAKVISITNIDGSPADVEVVYSQYDGSFGYKVGETVQVDDYDIDRWHECAPGIHFFITRQEAVDY